MKTQAQSFRGTKDWLGLEMRWRQSVINTVRGVLESFGFEPLETPIIETISTLTGKYGEEGEGKLFRLSGSGTDAKRGGLRYDQTVPLARIMAMYWQKVILPYRRYAIGPVFRNESTQAGRFRQFTQCDFDTVGSTSQLVDAEIPAMNYSVLTKLGFPAGSFQIQINDRRLLNALVLTLGVTEKDSFEVFRAWDKIEKVGKEEASRELLTKGLAKAVVDQFVSLTETLETVSKMKPDQALGQLAKDVSTTEVVSAVESLTNLFGNIAAMEIPDWAYKFSPLLARGLDYYTGPIFETYAGVLGSITGGGRFDKLIATLGGPDLPASGSSFGLERVMGVMEELGLKPDNLPVADAYITVFDSKDPKLVQASFEIATMLRLTGLKVEVYTGDQSKLGKQFNIAERKNIPLVFVIGPDELRTDSVTIKDMFASQGKEKQFTVGRKDTADLVRTLLRDK